MTTPQPRIIDIDALTADLAGGEGMPSPQQMLDLRQLALEKRTTPELLRIAVERLRSARTAMSGTATKPRAKASKKQMSDTELDSLL